MAANGDEFNGHQFFTSRGAVRFPLTVGPGTYRSLTVELKPFFDPGSRLGGEFAFAEGVWVDPRTGEPCGVWVIKRPMLQEMAEVP